MAVEKLLTGAFRVIPEGLRYRIVTGWANETSFLNRLTEEFKDAPNFDLHYAEQEEVKGVLFGAQDGYIMNQLKDGQINLHFTVGNILKRKDLVETEMGIGIYRLWGYFVFSENATSLFYLKVLELYLWNLELRG